MQLDVDVSLSVNIITFRLGLTHLSFHIDPRNFGPVTDDRLQTEYDAYIRQNLKGESFRKPFFMDLFF